MEENVAGSYDCLQAVLALYKRVTMKHHLEMSHKSNGLL